VFNESLHVREDAQLLLPPGTKLRGWLSMIVSHETMTQVVDPSIARMQDEWAKAHADGKTTLAGWIKIRGPFALIFALAARIRRALLGFS